MEATLKVIFAFLFLFVFKQGGADQNLCTLSDIQISTSKTGRFIDKKPEFEVIVNNNCRCSQSELIVGCAGFSSAEEVDPSIFKQINGQQCQVNDGRPIYQDSPVTFVYASCYMYELPTVCSKVNCK